MKNPILRIKRKKILREISLCRASLTVSITHGEKELQETLGITPTSGHKAIAL